MIGDWRVHQFPRCTRHVFLSHCAEDCDRLVQPVYRANASANLLQENLRFGSLELFHVQFPLFFVPRSHVILHRSAWEPLIHRGRSYPPARVDAGAVHWTTQEISAFLQQEERRGVSLAVQVQDDPRLQPLLAAEPNLLRRVMCADPLPTP